MKILLIEDSKFQRVANGRALVKGVRFRLPRFIRVLVWIGRGIGKWYLVLRASYAAPALRIKFM